MVASPSVLAQSCPSTGCNIPGLTVPNNLDICQGTGTNIHDPTLFTKGHITQLCNTQPIDPANWVYGPEHDLTAAQQAAPFWNQVMTKMAQGLPVIGRRWSAPDGSDYCNVAPYVDSGPSANHFTWGDERHAALDNSTLWTYWRSNTICPGLTYDTTGAKAALGSSLDEREAQHDGDGGAIVFFRPVNSVRDAQEAIFWSFWPPFGHRSQGGAPSNYDAKISQIGAGAYRDSYNMNAVMVAQIATVAGAQAVDGIAALDGIDALYLDDEDLAFQAASVAQYNQLASAVRAAARAHGKYLCTVDRTATPNVMTCLPSTALSAADMAKREWPLRRLDSNGMPFGSTRIASIASSPNTKE
jgi:hypothetical protein